MRISYLVYNVYKHNNEIELYYFGDDAKEVSFFNLLFMNLTILFKAKVVLHKYFAIDLMLGYVNMFYVLRTVRRYAHTCNVADRDCR